MIRRSVSFRSRACTAEFLRPRAGALFVAHTFGHKESLRSPLLAGFELDLDDIFAS